MSHHVSSILATGIPFCDFATHRTQFFCVGPRCSTSKNNISTWWNPRFFVVSWSRLSLEVPVVCGSLISSNLKAVKLKTRYFQLPHQKLYTVHHVFQVSPAASYGNHHHDPAGLNHWSWPPLEALLPGAPNPWRPPDLKTDEVLSSTGSTWINYLDAPGSL